MRNKWCGSCCGSKSGDFAQRGAFIFGAANFASVVVDHYDKRNNETNYQRFAKVTRIIGLTLLFLGFIVSFVASWD